MLCFCNISRAGGNVANFDMRGQHVTNQYNAGRDINFGAVRTPFDFVAELEKFKAELGKARSAGILDEDTATDVEYQVTKAIQHASKPEGTRHAILEHLRAASAIIAGITSASGLVTALAGAIQVVQKLFS